MTFTNGGTDSQYVEIKQDTSKNNDFTFVLRARLK